MNTVLDFSAFPPNHHILELERLRRDLVRLTEENDDLRASALVWQRLYEAAVKRARDLEQRPTDPGYESRSAATQRS